MHLMMNLHVEVRGGDIVVTLPGTRYVLTYRKSEIAPGLVASGYMRDDPREAVMRTEFLERARRLGTDKARELGWIA
jgi:hypothetical protein